MEAELNDMQLVLVKESYLQNIVKNIIFSEDAKRLLNLIIEKNYKTISSFLFTIMSSDMLVYYNNLNNSQEISFLELTRLKNNFNMLNVKKEDNCLLNLDIYDLLYHRNCRQYDIYSKFTGTFYELIDGDITFFTKGYDVDNLIIDNISELVHILLDIVESIIIDYSFKYDVSEIIIMLSIYKGDLVLNFNKRWEL